MWLGLGEGGFGREDRCCVGWRVEEDLMGVKGGS